MQRLLLCMATSSTCSQKDQDAVRMLVCASRDHPHTSTPRTLTGPCPGPRATRLTALGQPAVALKTLTLRGSGKAHETRDMSCCLTGAHPRPQVLAAAAVVGTAPAEQQLGPGAAAAGPAVCSAHPPADGGWFGSVLPLLPLPCHWWQQQAAQCQLQQAPADGSDPHQHWNRLTPLQLHQTRR